MFAMLKRLRARLSPVIGEAMPPPHPSHKRAAEGKVYTIIKEKSWRSTRGWSERGSSPPGSP
jgi:hypothetical protein